MPVNKEEARLWTQRAANGGIAAIDMEVARLQARSSDEVASDRAALAVAVSRIRAEIVPQLHAGIACAS